MKEEKNTLFTATTFFITSTVTIVASGNDQQYFFKNQRTAIFSKTATTRWLQVLLLH